MIEMASAIKVVIFGTFFFGVTFAARRRVPPWQIKLAQRQGPHTCAVEEVSELGRQYFTDCKYWLHREICGYKTVVRYECCEGYERVPGRNGCPAVSPLQGVLQTAARLGATQFVDHVKRSASLRSELERQARSGAITLLAPSDRAFASMSSTQRYNFEVALERNMLYHMLPGRVYVKDLPEEDSMIRTMDPYGRKVRISRFSNSITTANCRMLARKDHDATDGVVHILDGVMLPPQDRDLLQTLSDDGRFRVFVRLLYNSQNLINTLSSEQATYTVFAPSDEAFHSMSPSELQRIEYDPKVTAELLRHHIVPHSLCAPAVLKEHKISTVGSSKLRVHCDASGVKIGDSNRISDEYIFARNGIVSVISDVAVPEKVRSVWSLMETRRSSISQFMDLLQQHSLDHTLRDNGPPVTVFAPTNSALEMYARERGYHSSQAYLAVTRTLLQRHLIYGEVLRTDEFTDQKTIRSGDGFSYHVLRVSRQTAQFCNKISTYVPTAYGECLSWGLTFGLACVYIYYGGNDWGDRCPQTTLRSIHENSVVLSSYHFKGFGIDSAMLQTPDIQGQNGVVHIIDRVLDQPYRGSLMDSLQKDQQFSTFAKALKRSKRFLEDDSNQNNVTTFYTVFAPNNEAFEKLSPDEAKELLNHPDELIEAHIVRGLASLRDVENNLLYKIKTEGNETLLVSSKNGNSTVNNANIVQADQLTSSGFVHTIDNILH